MLFRSFLLNRISGIVGSLTTLAMVMLFTISLAAQQPAPEPAPELPVFKKIDVAQIFDATTEAVLALPETKRKRRESIIRRNLSFAKARVYEILRGGSGLNDIYVIEEETDEGEPKETPITNQQLLNGWYRNY